MSDRKKRGARQPGQFDVERAAQDLQEIEVVSERDLEKIAGGGTFSYYTRCCATTAVKQ